MLPVSERRLLKFESGEAIGISNRWQKGQYCAVLTQAGIVGCGIYDLPIAAEFDLAVAICRGTPAKPLVVPEDLFESKIVDATPKARSYGIEPGMKGRQAVELMLKAGAGGGAATAPPVQVRTLDHVTVVVSDLDRSRKFYCGILGMREVPRPTFSFPGLWFQAGDTQIHLIGAHEGAAAPGAPPLPAQVRPGRSMHYAFEVADARAAHASLIAAGVRVLAEPRLRPDGCVQVFMLDPDGHVVEVFSRPPL
ncbi:MAG: DUF1805 domain-containing protein [Planctomycetia bacterium]|nr:DUF1805 domain-containing protein [Planctomycetia bacterium]